LRLCVGALGSRAVSSQLFRFYFHDDGVNTCHSRFSPFALTRPRVLHPSSARSLRSAAISAVGLINPIFAEEFMQASYKVPLRPALVLICCLGFSIGTHAQSGGGNSTSVIGTVTDPSGAVVPNATVEIRNPVSAFERTVTTDASGRFTI